MTKKLTELKQDNTVTEVIASLTELRIKIQENTAESARLSEYMIQVMKDEANANK